MFRTKLAVTLLVAFAAVAAVVFLYGSHRAETLVEDTVQRRLESARNTLVAVRAQQDFALVARATRVAGWPQMAQVLALPKEHFADPEGNLPSDYDYRGQIHDQMFPEVLVWWERFKYLDKGDYNRTDDILFWPKGKPDMFWVVDGQGHGVAKPTDRAWFGREQANIRDHFPEILRVVGDGSGQKGGETLKTIWMEKGAPMSIAAAPIRAGGRVLGSVILGTQVAVSEATRGKELTGVEVAFFVGDQIGRTSTLRSEVEKALHEVFVADKLGEKETVGRKPIEFKLNGRRHLAFVSLVPGSDKTTPLGILVFADVEAEVAAATRGLAWIFAIAFAGFLLTLGLAVSFLHKFVEPLEEIDRGVLEIVNGNLDYWFTSGDKGMAGTMSQNLNIMVCQLSGRPLPEEDDAPEGEHWAEDRMFIDELDSSQFRVRPIESSQVPADGGAFSVPSDADSGMGFAPDILRLIRETEDGYKRRLFKDYTEQLRDAGEPVQGITYEKFMARLEANAEALRAKYNCNRVRFLVVTRDGKVTLRPVPIN